ncbi:MAG: alpha/beta fold hydrolase [Rubrivivax sp.]
MSGLPACEASGAGPDTVLLLHGIGGGAAMWGEQGSDSVAALAGAGLRAVAVDLPGYGGSATLGPVSLAGMVDAVVALIGTLAPRRVALVGHSMGGMVAQELAATRPGVALHALVLACTSPAFGKPEGDWQAKFVADRLAPLDAGLGMPGMAAKLVPAMVSPQAVPGAQARALAVMARVPEATYRAALASIVAFDRRAALPAIAVPTLCLAAEHDRTAPPEVMQRMAAKITGAEYLCLSAAGHIANVEQPAAFNGAVLAFLQRHGFGS